MAGQPKPVSKKAGVSTGAIITLVVAFLVLCVGMYYADTLKGVVFLRPWSKAGPMGAIRAYAKALEADDEGARKAVGGSVGFECTVEGDASWRSIGRRSAPSRPRWTRPRCRASRRTETRITATRPPPIYTAMLPVREGGRLSFGMTRVNGKWATISLNPIGTGKQ